MFTSCIFSCIVVNTVGRLVFFLCLYNHFLPQKFVLQCSHWNLLIPSQLGGGTETSESVGEESDSIVT